MMKKTLFVAVLAAISLNAFGAFGYKIRVKNSTDGEISLFIAYGGAGICNSDTVKVSAGRWRSIDAQLCCAKPGIRIKSTSGRAKGKMTRYDGPRTGAGLSCRGFDFKVSNTADGGLIAETVKITGKRKR